MYIRMLSDSWKFLIMMAASALQNYVTTIVQMCHNFFILFFLSQSQCVSLLLFTMYTITHISV